MTIIIIIVLNVQSWMRFVDSTTSGFHCDLIEKIKLTKISIDLHLSTSICSFSKLDFKIPKINVWKANDNKSITLALAASIRLLILNCIPFTKNIENNKLLLLVYLFQLQRRISRTICFIRKWINGNFVDHLICVLCLHLKFKINVHTAFVYSMFEVWWAIWLSCASYSVVGRWHYFV